MVYHSLELSTIFFIAKECARQQSGEESVARMCEAWLYLESSQVSFAHSFLKDYPDRMRSVILKLAETIEPEKNEKGYRSTPVRFNATGTTVGWENISRQMDNLIASMWRLKPDEFYQEFQKIHPFADGNGRIGVILYNLLKGTLRHKEHQTPQPFTIAGVLLK